MNTPKLVIKSNNTQMVESCALCGGWCEAPIGPAIFVEGTFRAVCDKCAGKQDPGLYLACCASQQAFEGRLQHELQCVLQPDTPPFAQEPPVWVKADAQEDRLSWPDGPDRDTQLDALIDRLSMQADSLDLLLGRVNDLAERLAALHGVLQWKGRRDD